MGNKNILSTMNSTNIPSKWPENPFWEFSLKFYGQKGVSEILIWFQENWQADVNILLYFCWAGISNANSFTVAEIRSLQQAVKRWNAEIVGPLRSLRRTLKTDTRGAPESWVQVVRTSIQEAELEAEHLQQLLIFLSHPQEAYPDLDQESCQRNIVNNIVLYLTEVGCEPDSITKEKVVELTDMLLSQKATP